AGSYRASLTIIGGVHYLFVTIIRSSGSGSTTIDASVTGSPSEVSSEGGNFLYASDDDGDTWEFVGTAFVPSVAALGCIGTAFAPSQIYDLGGRWVVAMMDKRNIGGGNAVYAGVVRYS